MRAVVWRRTAAGNIVTIVWDKIGRDECSRNILAEVYRSPDGSTVVWLSLSVGMLLILWSPPLTLELFLLKQSETLPMPLVVGQYDHSLGTLYATTLALGYPSYKSK